MNIDWHGLWGRIRARLAPLWPLARSAWRRALPGNSAWVLAALLAGGLALGLVYLATQRTMTLEINGVAFELRTHQRTALGVLREAGVQVAPDDVLQAPAEEPLPSGSVIRLTVPRRVHVIHDGMITSLRTFAPDVAGALAEAGVEWREGDRLTVDGMAGGGADPLPVAAADRRRGIAGLLADLQRPLRLAVVRAVPLVVNDGGVSLSGTTTAQTVGEALWEQGVIVYTADLVYPALDAPMTSGLTVYIERAKPITLEVGGQARPLRTRLGTVDELLADQGVTLGALDYIEPAGDAVLETDLLVRVVRVYEERYIEETPIAFETRWEPDPAMEIDTSRIAYWGREGAQRRRILVRYENGQETARTQEEEWVAHEPQARVYKYGTQIVLRTIETPNGTLTYWRKLRLLATSYSARTAGTPASSPHYGITRSGLPARKGLVAVDTSVISLMEQVYVPGYGVGLAADTGGGIKGLRIDLCYDDDNLEHWRLDRRLPADPGAGQYTLRVAHHAVERD